MTCVYTGEGGASSRRERAYTDLKWRLLVGDFVAGERLGEERLAALLGVSRTPVREALLRLYAESLVVRLPDGGYAPAVPDLVGVRDLYEVRMSLELAALHRPDAAGIERDEALIDALVETWRAYRASPPEPDPSFVVADEHFHVSLATSAGNGAFVEFLESVNARIRSIRMRDFLSAERIATTIDEHLAILAAVAAGAVDDADAYLTEHLRQSMEVASARAASALDRMAGGAEAARS